MDEMKKGFTLIELVVVLAVLGIVFAVAIPKIAYFMGGTVDTKWKVVYDGKTEIFAACDSVYKTTCHDCKRDNGSEIRICGSYTIEKLELN